jgi:hypothetical protein
MAGEAVGAPDALDTTQTKVPVARVCAYARQCCLRPEGCTIGADQLASWSAKDIELQAWSCTEAGSPLLAREAAGAYMEVRRNDAARRSSLRARYIERLTGQREEPQ